VIAETERTAMRSLREKKRFAEIGALLDRIIANLLPETIT
jgi:hypothetical protein